MFTTQFDTSAVRLPNAKAVVGSRMLHTRTWIRPARANTAQYTVRRSPSQIRCQSGNTAPAVVTRRSTLGAVAALFVQPAFRARAEDTPEQVRPQAAMRSCHDDCMHKAGHVSRCHPRAQLPVFAEFRGT